MDFGIKKLEEFEYLDSNKNIIVFPSLKKVLKHGVTIGENTKNMSRRFETTPQKASQNIRGVLTQLNMNPNLIFSISTPIPYKHTIIDIRKEDLKKEYEDFEIDLQASGVFTDIKGLPLACKVADCPVLIVLGVNKNKNILGIIHSGRIDTDSKIPQLCITHLKNKYSLEPKDIFVGIAPSIDKKDYFLQKKDVGVINSENWSGFIHERVVENESRIYLDIKGNIINQLLNSGIKKENIECFYPPVDTVNLALKGMSFSHRLSAQYNMKPGRFMAVAQL